ncbi:serine O-acetyltransferase [Acaryochloris marina]|uniref:serine O-acetyltransferase n=1 Tax=Acaryochloris marina TaxID=155978 RepID=UPI001BAF5807|nr:hypothetical protein [Acaryochloris marina]QUY40602.1 hypothetical protein I1H34_14825 [Acaryochloris marina S15]
MSKIKSDCLPHQNTWSTLVEDFSARYGYEPKSWISVVLASLRMGEFAAVLLYRTYQYFYYRRRIFPGLRIFLYSLLRSKFNIDIHPDAIIEGGLVIHHAHLIIIGSGVRIGKRLNIYHNVTIGARSINKLTSYPKIGDDVVIYPGSVLAGGINVGDNVIIGANSLVLDDIPNNSTLYANKSILISKN